MTTLPWYRESAFRTWLKRTTLVLSGAIGAVSEGADFSLVWKALLVVAADAILSAPDIFLLGPEVQEVRPAPEVTKPA